MPAWLLLLLTSHVTANPGEWSQLPALPDEHGFAGMFAGVSHGVLVVAGGANFPDKKPWEGGMKVWHRKIFVLEKPNGPWRTADELPRALAYGVSVTYHEGIICVGGSDSERHHADVLQLEWREGRIVTTQLPALPVTLANACGALAGDKLIVAGGQFSPSDKTASKRLWQLDLAAPDAKWIELPALPGNGRILAMAAAYDGKFWLVGGAELIMDADAKVARRYCRDAWCYDFKSGWKAIADLPQSAVAAPSPMPVDANGFFLVGGDDGSQVATSPAEHRGFSKSLLHYDAAKNAWKVVGDSPAPRVTVPCVSWNSGWIIPSGETRPGIRSPEVWQFTPATRRSTH